MLLSLIVVNLLSAYADTIVFHTGQTMDGVVEEENETRVVLNVGVGTVTIPKGKIERIIYKDDQSALRDEWARHYFSHKRYVPPGCELLAETYNALDAKYLAAVKAAEALKASNAARTGYRREIESVRARFIASAHRLEAEKELGYSDHYNDLVTAHNALSGRMVILNDAIQKSYERDENRRTIIADFLRGLEDFDKQYQQAKARYAAAVPPHEIDVFLNEIGRHLDTFHKEVQSSSIPYEKRRGHYLVSARINDSINVRLMLDTGATFVTLTETCARRLGLQLDPENQIEMAMADGSRSQGIRVILDAIQVGDVVVHGVSAVVMGDHTDSDMDGLLGMSFLRGLEVRLDSDVGGLTLRRFIPGGGRD